MDKKLILSGIGTSIGIAKAKVKIINSKEDFGKVEEGDILVTKMTDPSMTIIINKASAIITDIGGLTSHPAIISRELGIPCIVGTKEATKILEDNQEIEVDGEKGEIYNG